MKVNKTALNPHGLTNKQRLVIEDMVMKVKEGKPLNAVESTQKFYDVTTKNSAKVQTHRNFNNKDFRQALLEELGDIGEGAVISDKLKEGLWATTDKGSVDYNARLKYIQEVNKITGVYAPVQSEKKSMNLTVDLSDVELNQRIKELQEELK